MARGTAVLLVFMATAFNSTPLLAERARQCCPTVYCWCQPCTTIYKAGNESSDLQVHIRGSRHDVVEAFFNESAQRYSVPDGIDLCANGRVLMPAKNDRGTFAICYGTAGFTAFGWKGEDLFPLTCGRNEYPASGTDPGPHIVQIDIDSACPIHLEWVTTRVLRITHGRGLAQEYLLRFDGDAKPWKLLYKGPVGSP
ncbi:hypothetical protein [Lacipirellula sp.]|uniref:hypothetical protein n=1 Tax=Lacipirellula sp. TaxID=2691419 RepID=UPI003D0D039F